MKELTEMIDRLRGENRRLKRQVFELQQRIEWVKDLLDGRINNSLLKQIIKQIKGGEL